MIDSEQPLYLDGDLYDAMNGSLVADRDLFVQRARALGGPVLEVACGTGRVTLAIAQLGLATTGLDLSPAMLKVARRKSAALPAVSVNWVEADCRAFDLNQKFNFIFIAFNSMLHLLTRTCLESFFANVRRHLQPNGRFMIDIFNPSIQMLARDRTLVTKMMSLKHPLSGAAVQIDESIDYDSASQVNQVTWYFDIEGQRPRTEHLKLRCFFPQEIDALLHYNGFEILEKMGDYEGSQFGRGSAKQILVCRLRES